MTIIERLRFLASGQDDPHSTAIGEAADELERLTAENFKLAAGVCPLGFGDEGGTPRCCAEAEIKRLQAENEALRADAERLAAVWRDAYLSFLGAFDTPQQRRLMPDEYSQDARTRLREFNYAIDMAKEQKP